MSSGPTAIVKVKHLDQNVSIEQAREELHQARALAEKRLAALKAEVHRATDWRTFVRRHPVATAAAAITVGLLVFSLFRRR
jgi:ElaB/YqjD/DUF883 family membrane-anchored ribosome-binding protein